MADDEARVAFFDMPQDYFGKGSWSTIHELDYMDDIHDVAAAPISNAEDVIKQVHSKRPMGRIERVFGVSTLEKTAVDDFRKLASAIYLQDATLIVVYANWSFAAIEGISWGWAGVIWLYNIVFYIPTRFDQVPHPLCGFVLYSYIFGSC